MSKKKNINHSTVAVEVSAGMPYGEFESIVASQIASIPEETIQNLIFNSSKDVLLNSLWFLEGREVFDLGGVPLFIWYASKEKQGKLLETIRDAIHDLEISQMVKVDYEF